MSEAAPAAPPSAHPWLPYVAPLVTFLVLTQAESSLPQSSGGPHPTWYPIAYAAKIAIVAAVAVASRSAWRDLRPVPGVGGLVMAVGMGLAVTALWVGLDGHYPPSPFGKRQGFDPNVLSPAGKAAFLAARLFGLVALVPLIEELFWRSFLWRWVIDQDFWKVPIGRATPAAVGVTSVLFAAAHPEWLPALLTGLAWAWLVWKTKSLAACVVSHVVANLALGVYVLATGAWKFL